MTRQLATRPEVQERITSLEHALRVARAHLVRMRDAGAAVHGRRAEPIRGSAAAERAHAAPEVAWWESFGDPVLTDLIGRAAHENRDIKIAAERVRAARAGETISRSSLLPSFGATAGALITAPATTARASTLFRTSSTGSAALSVSWEVDLSGRLRAGAAAAAADTMATEDKARGVRLLVLSDVATNYFTLVGALEQLETVRAISAAQDETLRLVTARQRVGLASPFDVERARTEASSGARSDTAARDAGRCLAAPDRRADRRARRRTRRPSCPRAARRSFRTSCPDSPRTFSSGGRICSHAHAQLEAANFRRRQAAAEWFPRLFVSALFGRQSLDLNGAGSRQPRASPTHPRS